MQVPTLTLYSFQTLFFICDCFDCKLWSVTCSCETWKKVCWKRPMGPIITKRQNIFDSRAKSEPHWQVCAARVVAYFSQACLLRLLPTRKCPVFVLARRTSPSCAGARPQELGHWFCSKNLWLSGGIWIACGNYSGAGTWTQTRTLQPDQQGVKVLSAPKSQNNMCGVWSLFRSTPKLRTVTAASRLQPSSPRLPQGRFNGLPCLWDPHGSLGPQGTIPSGGCFEKLRERRWHCATRIVSNKWLYCRLRPHILYKVWYNLLHDLYSCIAFPWYTKKRHYCGYSVSIKYLMVNFCKTNTYTIGIVIFNSCLNFETVFRPNKYSNSTVSPHSLFCGFGGDKTL